jgi:hypothetical protein
LRLICCLLFCLFYFFLEAFEEVYFNAEWFRAKLDVFGVGGLIDDFDLYKTNDFEVNAVYECLMLSEKALLQIGDNQAADKLLYVELTARLLPYYGQYVNINKLIDQCDRMCMRVNPIVPISRAIQVPCE